MKKEHKKRGRKPGQKNKINTDSTEPLKKKTIGYRSVEEEMYITKIIDGKEEKVFDGIRIIETDF